MFSLTQFYEMISTLVQCLMIIFPFSLEERNVENFQEEEEEEEGGGGGGEK